MASGVDNPVRRTRRSVRMDGIDARMRGRAHAQKPDGLCSPIGRWEGISKSLGRLNQRTRARVGVCASRMSRRYHVHRSSVDRSNERWLTLSTGLPLEVPYVEVTRVDQKPFDLDGVSAPKVSIFKFDSEHEQQWREQVLAHGGNATETFRPHYFVIANPHPVMLQLYPIVSLVSTSTSGAFFVKRISLPGHSDHPYDDLQRCAAQTLEDPKMLEEFASIKPVPFLQPALLAKAPTASRAASALPVLLF